MKRKLLKIYYFILKIRKKTIIGYNICLSKIMSPPLVHNTEKTLDKVIKDKCSVSRYGDGEFSLMNGESLLFQPYSAELSSRLKDICNSHLHNHMVCIPNVFNDLDWCAEKPKKYWVNYLKLNRHKIYKLLDSKKIYYDALITRLYIDHKDKRNAESRFINLKKLWEKRNVIIVEGFQSRLGAGNNLFDNANLIKRIICPAINAFEKYEFIMNEVKVFSKSNLILIALGPTATVLAYDLAKLGYQAVDIGHVDIEYEWFLQQAVEKCPVKNKYIGEIPHGNEVEVIGDEKYEKEIILKII